MTQGADSDIGDRTHLLELDLSSPTHVGIRREGCYNSTPHNVDIHSGRTSETETGGGRRL